MKTASFPSTRPSGVTLLDGTSSSNQTVTAAFDPSPPASGGVRIVNQAIDLDFSVAAGLYVIPIGYQDADVPAGFLEEELIISSCHTGNSEWVEAITLNGNSGASPEGAKPFVGSYSAYLAVLGGGSLDAADLSAYGLDPTSNTAWVVIDREGKFRLGSVAVGSLPREVLSLTRNPLPNVNTITYQSVAGEVFAVKVSEDLVNFTDLSDTAVGDGTIKTYTHSPALGKNRQFYKLIRN